MPETLRGTYAGLASPAAFDIFKPGRHGGRTAAGAPFRSDDQHLSIEGSPTTGATTPSDFLPRTFVMPVTRVAESRCNEFKTMVKTLHSAGIEVILDVVYNHTGEGNHLGSDAVVSRDRQCRVLSARAENPRYYMDYTGCGNTLERDASAHLAAHHG